ncbi:MAG: hypothetical protein JOZ45_20910 [Acidobacteriaceae bacterium]|nr:hypothetical protein [Acidobacteriaceae bacterium]
MARGWESKSVESQVDAAEAQRTGRRQTQLSEEELRLQRERESIELSKVRILRELEAAKHPRHREQLAAVLAYLEHQLELKAPHSNTPPAPIR